MPRLALSSRVLRWIPAPALLLLLVLVGMAVDSESRREFESGLNRDSAQPEQSAAESGATEAGGSNPDPESGSPNGAGEFEEPDETSPSIEDQSANTGPDISLEVRGDDGTVGVRLDPAGADVAFPRTRDGASGLPTELTPDGLPPGAGFRLSSDGRLEVVQIAETEPGDIVLDPSPLGGIDLARDDGSRIEVRTRSGENGEPLALALTEVDAEGQPTALTADRDGEVAIGDGISIQLPTFSGEIPEPDEPMRIAWRWFLAWIVSTVVASLAVALYLWRNSPALPFAEDFQAPPEVRVTGFADFITVLRMDRDPSRAIRLAFQGAEGGLGSLPQRQPTETPFEWHSRVSAEHSHLDAVLGSLCSRFTTARFAPERPSPADRDAAIDELEELAYLAGYHEAVGRNTAELIGSVR